MVEEWRDIKGYEGKYQVSNTGKVRSLNYNHTPNKIKELSQKTDKYGYKTIQLHDNGLRKHITVHRLVANEFIANSDNKPQVNHIDANKENNNINNLEWATNKENITHGRNKGLFVNLQLASVSRRVPVVCINKSSGLIIECESLTDAGNKLGTTASQISEVVHGHRKSVHGYCVYAN